MVRADTDNPDHWSLRSTVTWGDVWLCAIFGVMGLLAWSGVIPFEDDQTAFTLLVSAFLLGVAVVPVAWRVEVTVDRREATVTACYGLFVPMFRHTIDIAPVCVVLERSVLFDYESPNMIRHEITLQTDGGRLVYVGHIPDAMIAHAVATDLAMFLDVQLVDRTELIRARTYWPCLEPWFACRPMNSSYLRIGPDGNWRKASETRKEWKV